jgi:hypothetical protein
MLLTGGIPAAMKGLLYLGSKWVRAIFFVGVLAYINDQRMVSHGSAEPTRARTRTRNLSY